MSGMWLSLDPSGLNPFQSAMANLTFSLANMSRELRGMQPMPQHVAKLNTCLKERPATSLAATDPQIELLYSGMIAMDKAISAMDRVNLSDTDLVDVIDTLTTLQSDLVNADAYTDFQSLQMADSFLSLATMSLASGFDAIDDVQSEIDTTGPNSVHLKLRSAKVVALNLAQIQVREAMDLMIDPVKDAPNYGKIRALDLDFDRPLSKIKLDYDK